MTYTPSPPLGQTTKSGSLPVTLASDQGDLSVTQKAATMPSATAMQVGATANGNGTSLNVQGYAVAILSVTASVAMSGGTTINFEVSVDDTTWDPVLAHQVGASGTLSSTTTTTGSFRLNVAGFKSVRARISAYSAGTISVAGNTTTLSAQPTTVGLASGSSVQITNGTQIGDTIAGDTGQNSLLVTGARKEVTFTTGAVAAVGTTDVSNYRNVSVHIISQGTSSTVTFQGSNNNTDWVSVELRSAAANTTSAVSATTAGIIYRGICEYRYFRLNVTGISAGTTAGVIQFFSTPGSMASVVATSVQSGTWTVQPGNTQNTTPWAMEQRFTAAHTTTATTTTVKSGAGLLHGISINTAAVTSTITVYDNTSAAGTVLAVIDSTIPRTVTFNCTFATGLTLVTSGATDLTISYR